MRRLYVSLILRGNELDPKQVTKILGLSPSKSFKKGDIRKGDKKWPHGYWELETSNNVDSDNPIAHIEWLMNNLAPSQKNLKASLQDENIVAEISCFWILSDEHYIINLSQPLLDRIARLGLSIKLDIYCGDE